MAEEPDAGGHSSDEAPSDEAPADAAGDDDEPAVDSDESAERDGSEPAERDGEDVDSEVEPQVGPEVASEAIDEAATADAEPRDGSPDDGSADGDESTDGTGGDGAGPDEAEAVGETETESESDTDAISDTGADGQTDATSDAETERDVETGEQVSDGDLVDPPAEGETGVAVPEEVNEGEVDDWADDEAGTPIHQPEPEPATDDPLADQPGGPPDDEEMPLADHIEEMILRLAIVSAVAAVAAGAVFFFEPLAEDTILFIWNSVIPHQDLKVHPLVGGTTHPGHYIEVGTVGSTNPRVYGPLELKLTELKFASLVGFVLALPVFVYETYRFMRPGLYPNERRYYLAAVPTSLVLAFVGVAFSYFIILPAIFAYFVRYSERAGVLAFALRQTFDLILVLMGYMALVFQIPLFIMLAIMMGLTDRLWLEQRRLYFWGGFLGVSFLFVPEPTGMAPILVALTMVGLFEGTLALLRWTGN